MRPSASGPVLAKYLQIAIESEIAVVPSSSSRSGKEPVIFFALKALSPIIASSAMTTSRHTPDMEAIAKQSWAFSSVDELT